MSEPRRIWAEVTTTRNLAYDAETLSAADQRLGADGLAVLEELRREFGRFAYLHGQTIRLGTEVIEHIKRQPDGRYVMAGSVEVESPPVRFDVTGLGATAPRDAYSVEQKPLDSSHASVDAAGRITAHPDPQVSAAWAATMQECQRAAILELCEREGYGATIHVAARAWSKLPSMDERSMALWLRSLADNLSPETTAVEAVRKAIEMLDGMTITSADGAANPWVVETLRAWADRGCVGEP